MKYIILIIAISLIPHLIKAQKIGSKDKGFGIALNSKINSQVSPILIIPSVSYYKGKNQFELGVGFYPFFIEEQRTLSGEFNYKYFPNGRENKFNMFLILSSAYINQIQKTYYPATYQYLFLNGGYGFQIRIFKGIYIGTNISIGIFTNSKQSENPYIEHLGSKDLFNTFHSNVSCQVKIGYLFN